MGTLHRVAENETPRRIASRYGVAPMAIWDHPRNRTLRQTRESDLLTAGDELWIPADSEPLLEWTGAPVPVRTGRSYLFSAAPRHTVTCELPRGLRSIQ